MRHYNSTKKAGVILFLPESEVSAFQEALVVKNLPANAGDVRDVGSIPQSRRSSGGGRGHPLQYSCLENPVDRGAWRAAVHWVAQSRTQLKRLSIYACIRKKGKNTTATTKEKKRKKPKRG